MKISLFNYSMLWYTPRIYRRNSCPTRISLNPHTKLDFKHHPTRNISDKFTIIRDLCRFLQPGLIFSTIFGKKLDFPTANQKKYIKLQWV